MAENPDSEKHQAMIQILELLGLPVDPSYFSEGGTVTKDALDMILQVVRERKDLIENIKAHINDAAEELRNL